MGYIKKTFKDKKVIKALVILVLALAASVAGYYFFKQAILRYIFLIVGTVIMFLQFPVISNTAMQYAEEEEAEEKAIRRQKNHPGKKK